MQVGDQFENLGFCPAALKFQRDVLDWWRQGVPTKEAKSGIKMFYMGALIMGTYVLHGCVCNFEVHVS